MFKPGDEVICLTTDLRGFLRKNNIYVVSSEWFREKDGAYFVKLKGVTRDTSFFSYRFKLIEEEEN